MFSVRVNERWMKMEIKCLIIIIMTVVIVIVVVSVCCAFGRLSYCSSSPHSHKFKTNAHSVMSKPKIYGEVLFTFEWNPIDLS